LDNLQIFDDSKFFKNKILEITEKIKLDHNDSMEKVIQLDSDDENFFF
jgi:hypothetical protein